MFHVTLSHGDQWRLTIFDKPDADHEIVQEYNNQNELRHAISSLDRATYNTHPRMSALPVWHDLQIVNNGETLSLWVYSRNWKGRGYYLAGVLMGRRYQWNNVRARRARRIRRKQGRTL